MKVLVLSASTGGGHNAVAAALTEALLASGVDSVETKDVWTVGGTPGGSIATALYNGPFRRRPSAFSAVYHGTNDALRWGLVSSAVAALSERRLDALVGEIRPDLILVVHPIIASVVDKLSDSRRWPEFRIVVTDPISVHESWICERAELTVFMSDVARRSAIKRGLTARRTAVAGYPVRSAFDLSHPSSGSESTPKKSDRHGLLMCGRGEPPNRETLLQLTKTLRLRRLVVAGGFQDADATGAHDDQRLAVLGWRSDIPTLMAETDIVISRLGPATLAEACAMRRPILAIGRSGPQENGNEQWARSFGHIRQLDSAQDPATAVTQLIAGAPHPGPDDSEVAIGARSTVDALCQGLI